MLRKAPIRTRKAVKLSTESVSHTGTELESQLHGVESYLAGVLATRCRTQNRTTFILTPSLISHCPPNKKSRHHLITIFLIRRCRVYFFILFCFLPHLREQDDDFESEWIPDFSSMSPMERYHILEKPYMVTPDWQTLCILKLHHETRKIRSSGIKFRDEWYWADEMSEYINQYCDIFYHAVEKPLVPLSLTVTVNGRFVCEAFPAQRLKYVGEDRIILQEHLDGQHRAEQKISKSLTRIKRSAAGILPQHIDKWEETERRQLRDECYAPTVEEAASSPDVPDHNDDAIASKTNSLEIDEIFASMFQGDI